MKLSDIMTNPGARYVIPGPFVTSYKNLGKLPNGTLYSFPLDDEHRVYLHVNTHVTLTVRKINYLGETRIEEIKYRASYFPVTNEFAVPIKRGINDLLYRKLCNFSTKLTGERFVSKLIGINTPVTIEAKMQINASMEAQVSGDPTTMVPRRLTLEGVHCSPITTRHLDKYNSAPGLGSMLLVHAISIASGLLVGGVIQVTIDWFNVGAKAPRIIRAANV